MPATTGGEDFAGWVRPHLLAMANLAARLAGPEERDDVVQEALTNAWRKRRTYDAGRGTVRVWLLAIVADRARRARRDRRMTYVLPADGGDPTPAPGDSGLELERAVAALPPRMAEVVNAHYFADLSVEETAAVLGISAGTVKSTLHDARARLRTMLEVTG